MIIWLASYPKSGNTWIRSFIAAILFSEDGNVGFENLSKIGQYPLISHFENFIDKEEIIKPENAEKLFKFMIPTQDLLNLDSKTKFYKTHFLNCKVGEYNFTNKINTLGVIHIVRDPRNVITSLKNHFSKKTIEDACNFMLDSDRWLVEKKPDNNFIKDNSFPTFISSWKNHYNFWKKTNKNYLLIKYEKLLEEPKEEFNKIVIYIEKILNIKIEKKKVEKAIESSSFKNLRLLEDQDKFDEFVKDKKNSKVRFFYMGHENNWKKILREDIRKKVEENFNKEMKELNYL